MQATLSLSNSNLCILHLQNMAEIHSSPALMVCTSICKPILLTMFLNLFCTGVLGILDILCFADVLF